MDSRLLRSVMQVGGVPDAVDCIKNWNVLSDSGLEPDSEADAAIVKYLAEFFGGMSAPPEWSIVREYFECDDRIDVSDRLDEVKAAQPYIATNYLAILEKCAKSQRKKTIIRACKEAMVIADHGMQTGEGKERKTLKGDDDALDYIESKLPQLRAEASSKAISSVKRVTPAQMAVHKWRGKRLMRHFPITSGRPNGIIAYAGSSKTWLAIELALAVAAGRETVWGGVPISLSGPVVHWDYEMGTDNLAQRYQRVANGMGLDLNNLRNKPQPKGLKQVMDRAAERYAELHGNGISNEELLSFVPFPPSLSSTGIKRILTDEAHGKVLFIIDSLLASTVGGKVEENSSEMRKFLDLLLQVSDETKCIFLIIHHERKGAAGDVSTKLQTMRGSSAIADGFGSTVHLEPVTNGFRIVQGKVSQGKGGDPVVCRLEDVGGLREDEVSEGIRIAPGSEADVDREKDDDANFIAGLIARAGGYVANLEDLQALVQQSNARMGTNRFRAAVKLLRDRGTIQEGKGYKLSNVIRPEDLL